MIMILKLLFMLDLWLGKKDISKELMPVTWHSARLWD